MLSLDGFVKMCSDHIEKQEAFIAYWHDNGFGLLRTDKVEYQQYTVRVNYPIRVGYPRSFRTETSDPEYVNFLRQRAQMNYGKIKVSACKKSGKAKAGTITKMRKEIARMRKTIWGLRVVEYDGVSVAAEGEGLEALE